MLPARRFFSALHDLCHEAAHRLSDFILLLPRGVGVGAESEPGIIVTPHGGYRCFATQILRGGICCNPGSNPAALRIQGITTPEDSNFVFYDPAAQALKLPALRAVVAEQGAFTTPALSACLFFVTR